MAFLSRIFIYPIKSLRAIELNSVIISEGGTLGNDRRFAIFDEAGKYVNGKKNERIFGLDYQIDFENNTIVFFSNNISSPKFSYKENIEEINSFLSNYFQQKVFFKENFKSGFPDDTKAYGPTLASLASFKEVNQWFPEIELDELIKRFRVNLIIDGVTTFWEDQLFDEENNLYQFQIGEVKFYGSNPCSRCRVPSKNTLTGETTESFQKKFAEQREKTLPEWANKNRFDHYYRFAVNTQIPLSEINKKLLVKDRVIITHDKSMEF